MRIIILIFSLLLTNAVIGGEVINSHVTSAEGRFHATLEMQINASNKKVFALFTDFNHLSRLNDNITESRLIDTNPPEYIVKVHTHNCVLFFCKDIQQTQQVHLFEGGYISVEDIPAQSDFEYAQSYWHIRASGSHTLVSFRSEMKPDFWLPPFLGPWLFKQRMLEETKQMINRLEQLANHDQ